MQCFNSIEHLIDAVEQRVGDAHGLIIAVEGHSTSGKSYLSEDLAKRVGATAVSTDLYAREGSTADAYVDRMDLDRLHRDLNQFRQAGAVIIEGICLRDTLHGLAIVPRLFVYVKRITTAGLWADDLENYLEHGRPASWLSWTDQQSVAYHLRERPEERADFVYERTEE
jgi:hypothetical protein